MIPAHPRRQHLRLFLSRLKRLSPGLPEATPGSAPLLPLPLLPSPSPALLVSGPRRHQPSGLPWPPAQGLQPYHGTHNATSGFTPQRTESRGSKRHFVPHVWPRKCCLLNLPAQVSMEVTHPARQPVPSEPHGVERTATASALHRGPAAPSRPGATPEPQPALGQPGRLAPSSGNAPAL